MCCLTTSQFTIGLTLSVQDVVGVVHDFNARSGDLSFDHGCTVAADMKDCFRHWPCQQGSVMWRALRDWWLERHVRGVNIPARRSGEEGQLACCTDNTGGGGTRMAARRARSAGENESTSSRSSSAYRSSMERMTAGVG